MKRTDNAFGFFVFIARWGEMRSGLTVALLDHVHTSPCLEPYGPTMHIREAAHLPVKTFPETASEIVGNISGRLVNSEVERALEELERKSIVWGYRVPMTIVNKVVIPPASP